MKGTRIQGFGKYAALIFVLLSLGLFAVTVYRSTVAAAAIDQSWAANIDYKFPTKPEGFRDCTVARMVDTSGYQEIIVMRCPKSTTTTSYSVTHGKSTDHFNNVVTDGVE
jgi:hypothetical protein